MCCHYVGLLNPITLSGQYGNMTAAETSDTPRVFMRTCCLAVCPQDLRPQAQAPQCTAIDGRVGFCGLEHVAE